MTNTTTLNTAQAMLSGATMKMAANADRLFPEFEAQRVIQDTINNIDNMNAVAVTEALHIELDRIVSLVVNMPEADGMRAHIQYNNLSEIAYSVEKVL